MVLMSDLVTIVGIVFVFSFHGLTFNNKTTPPPWRNSGNNSHGTTPENPGTWQILEFLLAIKYRQRKSTTKGTGALNAKKVIKITIFGRNGVEIQEIQTLIEGRVWKTWPLHYETFWHERNKLTSGMGVAVASTTMCRSGGRWFVPQSR